MQGFNAYIQAVLSTPKPKPQTQTVTGLAVHIFSAALCHGFPWTQLLEPPSPDGPDGSFGVDVECL